MKKKYRSRQSSHKSVPPPNEQTNSGKKAKDHLRKDEERGNLLLQLYENAPQLSDKQLYDYALEHAVRITDSTIGFFHLVSDDQKDIILTTWNSEAIKNCTAEYNTHYPIDKAGNWVDCVRFKRPVIYNDFANSPNQKGLPEGHSPLHRFMSIPVMEGDKVRIIFGVGNKIQEYDDYDVVQIQLVANELHKIIKQRHAEEALQKSEKQLKEAQRIGRLGNWDWDAATDTITWSEEYYRIYGLDPNLPPPGYEEHLKAYTPESAARLDAAVKHSMQTGERYQFDLEHIRPDGTRGWMTARGEVKRDANDKIVGLRGTAQDITERKRAENELAASQQLLQDLSDNSTSLIYSLDSQGRFLLINRSLESLFGIPRNMLIGKTRDAILPPEIAAAHQANDLKVMKDRQPITVEEENNESDGKHTYLSVKFPLMDPHGNVFGVGGISTDITARKQAEEAIYKGQQVFRTLVENSPDIIARYDRDCKRTYVNPVYLKATDIPRNELLATAPVQRSPLPAASAGILQNLLRKVLDSGVAEAVDVVWPKADNIDHWYNISAFPEFDMEGRVVSVMTISRDITDRRLAEEEIRKLNQELEKRVTERTTQLEAANKELEAFAYSASHDLRAPLRGIDGFSQVLLEEYQDKIDAQGKDYLQRVRSAAQRMAQLIDDMLNLSRVSRGEVNIQLVNLSEMAREIADDLHEVHPERPVVFSIQEGISARGDVRLLRIVLDNLFRNAWKFTSNHPAAHIEFGMQQQQGSPVYFVRDDGAGFDMKYVQKLFGAFQRLHATSEFPGTGVGLATVKRVIHRHGGEVWAEGEEEKGATFYFTIPEGA
jgi:PAS domain S-box-containing protein